MPRNGISTGTLRSVIEYGLPYLHAQSISVAKDTVINLARKCIIVIVVIIIRVDWRCPL